VLILVFVSISEIFSHRSICKAKATVDGLHLKKAPSSSGNVFTVQQDEREHVMQIKNHSRQMRERDIFVAAVYVEKNRGANSNCFRSSW